MYTWLKHRATLQAGQVTVLFGSRFIRLPLLPTVEVLSLSLLRVRHILFRIKASTVFLLDVPSVSFTVPKNLPSGQYVQARHLSIFALILIRYLVRMEALALHVAETFGGAQWYISCGQINVTGGGSGTPGPLVSIPGVYTGNVSDRMEELVSELLKHLLIGAGHSH